MNYIRNEMGVPFYIGELGIHIDNFEENSFGYHSYFIDEFHPKFNENLEKAFRTAFSAKINY